MKGWSNLSPQSQPRFGHDERDFVLKVTMKFLKNKDAAEDAPQDAMLQAFRHRDSFRGDAKFMTWLYRVAVRASLMQLRKRRREEQARADTLDFCALPAPGPDPEARTIAAAQLVRAGRHLAQMSPISGEVLRMNAEGYTSREIGAKLNINASTVKTIVHRGRLGLRAALDQASNAAGAAGMARPGPVIEGHCAYPAAL